MILFDQSQMSFQAQLSAGSQALLKDALSKMTNSYLIAVFGLLLILSSSSPFHSAELAKAGLATHFIPMYEHNNCKEYYSFLKNHLMFPEKSFTNLSRPARVQLGEKTLTTINITTVNDWEIYQRLLFSRSYIKVINK